MRYNMFGSGSLDCSSLPRVVSYSREAWTSGEECAITQVRALAVTFPYVIAWQDESHDEGSCGYILVTDAIKAWEIIATEMKDVKCKVYHTCIYEKCNRDHPHTPQNYVRLSFTLEGGPIMENIWTGEEYEIERPLDLFQAYYTAKYGG